jgi:hypothetical protein
VTDSVRRLNDGGIAKFREYLDSLRAGATASPPDGLLTDVATSEGLGFDIPVERPPQIAPFTDRYKFGCYLKERFAPLGPAAVAMDYGLWTWLSLYYFEQLCPSAGNGERSVVADEAYIVHKTFKYEEYYRHLVRTPWLVVVQHGDRSRVLLIPASAPGDHPLGKRGEIIEQLAARQTILGSSSLIASAYQMYFDESKGRPRRGAGGSGGGSPRRLALVAQQLELTYDLSACSAEEILSLLPAEFDRWAAKPSEKAS